MSEKGHIKHVFPGGNTSQGFFSYYDYILSQEEATRIIVLKGGPGVGKSSFMKKIGEEMVEQGYDVEYLHCSSDNNSLDGILIQKIKVAMVDGTAPHIVDPKNPGCVDEIIHLGEYWNEDGIRLHRQQIIETNTEVGKIFKRAYKYLKAAKAVYDDIEVIYTQSMDFAQANNAAQKLITDIFNGLGVNTTVGKVRHLFASAITPDGLKNHLESIVFGMQNMYILKGEPGTGKSTLLSKVLDYAISRGLYVEAYHCALDPEKIEHIIIPQLKTAIVTTNEYHGIYKTANAEIINMNDFANTNILNKYSDALAYDRKAFSELLNQAIITVGGAKKLHDLMETYYIPNMDFKKVEDKRIETLKRIQKYAQEF